MNGLGLRTSWPAVLAFCLASAAAGWAQSQSAQTKPEQKPAQQQDIPDAPSAVRPPQALPPAPHTSEGNAPPPAAPTPASKEQPASGAQPGVPEPIPLDNPPGPPPPFSVPTVPEGSVPPDESANAGFSIKVPVNAVLIPVRVTDDSGRLVDGLLPKDFVVYEDGRKQPLNFFTSSPFQLSAAVVLDLGMPDVDVQKVNQTFAALQGAFSPYDEVAVYTYSSTVGKMADFNPATNKKLTEVFNGLQTVTGRVNGPPILDGPIGPGGPVINGRPINPSEPHVKTPPQQSHVLNDAILAAALGLSKRDRTRRKIIFVISDGREIGSTASYRDVLKVLLTNGIAVYGVEVGAIPGYSALARLHLPRMGYSNILPKYASATAGEYITETSRNAIETAYMHAIGDARNQYTLGYAAHLTPSETYRQIEVTVDRPDLKVYAKDGYYPAPQPR